MMPLSIRVVSGHSMQPGIGDGSHLVVFRWAYAFSQPKPGDIIVFHGSGGREYVKRIIATANNEFLVEGDNKADSKKLPPVGRKSVIGKVVMAY